MCIYKFLIANISFGVFAVLAVR